MIYTHQNWKTGDVITADKLNYMELGIAEDFLHTTELLFEGDVAYDEQAGGVVIPVQFEDRMPLVIEADFSWHGKPIAASYTVGTSKCHHNLFMHSSDEFYHWMGPDVEMTYEEIDEDTDRWALVVGSIGKVNDGNAIHAMLNGKFYLDFEIPFYTNEDGWQVHLPENGVFYNLPESMIYGGPLMKHCCSYIMSTEIPDSFGQGELGICFYTYFEEGMWRIKDMVISEGNLISTFNI